jgi:hypothetical protein
LVLFNQQLVVACITNQVVGVNEIEPLAVIVRYVTFYQSLGTQVGFSVFRQQIGAHHVKFFYLQRLEGPQEAHR